MRGMRMKKLCSLLLALVLLCAPLSGCAAREAERYDVLVLGGGTAGVMAACAAGREGKKALILEREYALGGTATLSLTIPRMTNHIPGFVGNSSLAEELQQKYGVRCLAVNCLELGEGDLQEILRSLLYEFPVQELQLFFPEWVEALPPEHPIPAGLYHAVGQEARRLEHVRQLQGFMSALEQSEQIRSVILRQMDLGTGVGQVEVQLPRSLFYDTVNQQTGLSITDDGDLMEQLGYDVDAIYYLPNLRLRFVESTLYPFIGGDTVRRSEALPGGLQPAVNRILPYAAPEYTGMDDETAWELSLCCLENARDILLALETEFRSLYARNLTLSRLGEAVILPLCPDKGGCMTYDLSRAASTYLEGDIELLKRMRPAR